MKYYKMIYNGNLAEDKNYSSCLDVDLNGVDDYIIYNGKIIRNDEWSNIVFHCNLNGSILTDWLDNVNEW